MLCFVSSCLCFFHKTSCLGLHFWYQTALAFHLQLLHQSSVSRQGCTGQLPEPYISSWSGGSISGPITAYCNDCYWPSKACQIHFQPFMVTHCAPGSPAVRQCFIVLCFDTRSASISQSQTAAFSFSGLCITEQYKQSTLGLRTVALYLFQQHFACEQFLWRAAAGWNMHLISLVRVPSVFYGGDAPPRLKWRVPSLMSEDIIMVLWKLQGKKAQVPYIGLHISDVRWLFRLNLNW